MKYELLEPAKQQRSMKWVWSESMKPGISSENKYLCNKEI
jgi:hypothetical protein